MHRALEDSLCVMSSLKRTVRCIAPAACVQLIIRLSVTRRSSCAVTVDAVHSMTAAAASVVSRVISRTRLLSFTLLLLKIARHPVATATRGARRPAPSNQAPAPLLGEATCCCGRDASLVGTEPLCICNLSHMHVVCLLTSARIGVCADGTVNDTCVKALAVLCATRDGSGGRGRALTVGCHYFSRASLDAFSPALLLLLHFFAASSIRRAHALAHTPRTLLANPVVFAFTKLETTLAAARTPMLD